MEKPEPPKGKIEEEKMPFPVKVLMCMGVVVLVFLLGHLVYLVTR